jgi:Terminase large subunit, T4likevirus-type, N-terminal
VPKETIRYERNPFQRRISDALEKNKRITAIFGGWRAGKTDYTSFEHVIRRQLYNNPDVLHLICSNTYSQLFDSTLRPVLNWLNKLGIPHSPKEIPFSHKPFSLFIHDGTKWVEFLCRSMDNINTIAGLTLGSAWADEMWGSPKWAFDLINSRLSNKQSKHLQFVITSNTDEPEHWMYTEIVQAWEFNRKNKDGKYPREVIELVHGTSYENSANLADGYIESMATTLDEQMFQRYIMCQWVSLGSGKMFYNLDRNLHLKDLQYEKDLPLMVSSDFNLNPMCWSIWQQHKDELWCIDQLMVKGNADTETCCRELYERYKNSKHLIWFGDASGKSGTTKSQHSDYDIIRRFFNEKKIQLEMRVPEANPSIRDSANAVNARLKNALGQSFVFFDKKKCPDIILSVEGSKYKNGTFEKDDSKDRDPNTRVKTHFGDTVRYIVNRLYPVRRNASRILFEA